MKCLICGEPVVVHTNLIDCPQCHGTGYGELGISVCRKCGGLGGTMLPNVGEICHKCKGLINVQID